MATKPIVSTVSYTVTNSNSTLVNTTFAPAQSASTNSDDFRYNGTTIFGFVVLALHFAITVVAILRCSRKACTINDYEAVDKETNVAARREKEKQFREYHANLKPLKPFTEEETPIFEENMKRLTAVKIQVLEKEAQERLDQRKRIKEALVKSDQKIDREAIRNAYVKDRLATLKKEGKSRKSKKNERSVTPSPVMEIPKHKNYTLIGDMVDTIRGDYKRKKLKKQAQKAKNAGDNSTTTSSKTTTGQKAPAPSPNNAGQTTGPISSPMSVNSTPKSPSKGSMSSEFKSAGTTVQKTRTKESARSKTALAKTTS